MNVKPKTKRRYIMKVSQVAKIWIDYHHTNSKKKYCPRIQMGN
jgi:3-deoxy-D-arabino-heptulosonate 7-phosphate (DAHP) synthase